MEKGDGEKALGKEIMFICLFVAVGCIPQLQ